MSLYILSLYICLYIYYLYIYILSPRFCGCHLRDGPANHQALIVNMACPHQSHRTIGNKEFLKGHTSTSNGYTSELSAEKAGKNSQLPTPPCKKFDWISSQLLF